MQYKCMQDQNRWVYTERIRTQNAMYVYAYAYTSLVSYKLLCSTNLE